MDVSIVIVNYNTFQLTSNCISSIYEKTKNIEFEIILVDNNSTECNPKRFKETFPKIKLVESKKNLGFSKGNNFGIKSAKGKYILLLNSDTILLNNAVKLAYERIRQDEQIGVLSCKLILPNNSIQPSVHPFPSIFKEFLLLIHARNFVKRETWNNFFLGNLANYEKEILTDWVSGAFFMFPKNILKEFPGNRLHDYLFMYEEDILWCYFIKRKLNLKILYYPFSKVMHYNGGSSSRDKSIRDRDEFKRKLTRNRYNWMKKERGQFYTNVYFLLRNINEIIPF